MSYRLCVDGQSELRFFGVLKRRHVFRVPPDTPVSEAVLFPLAACNGNSGPALSQEVKT